MRSLKFLELSDNMIEELSESIGRLQTLEGLGLKLNKLSSIPKLIENLVSISFWNDYSRELPDWVKNLLERNKKRKEIN